MTSPSHTHRVISLTDVVPLPFMRANLTEPPVVCMICGVLVENTIAGMEAHKRFHDALTAGGIHA